MDSYQHDKYKDNSIIGGMIETFFNSSAAEFIVPLFVALFLGMIIGTERVFAHKTAGMRTYALVSMGSALFILISKQMIAQYIGVDGLNPLQLAAQVVVGVGFIGTGLIFTRESKLMGLTTATGLWVAAGIGMASGFGLYSLAILGTVFTLFIFIVLWFVEEQLKKTKLFKEGGQVEQP